MKKQYVKSVHFGVGVHLFGSATGLLAKPGRIELELTSIGVYCFHKEQRKKVLVPFSNLKAIEFDSEHEFRDPFFDKESESKEVLNKPLSNMSNKK